MTMSTFTRSLLAATALLAVTGAAQAADLGNQGPAYAEVPMPAPLAYDWSGVFIGAQAGYAWGRADSSFPAAPVLEMDHNVDGFLGGLYGGVNFQSGAFVYGIDLDMNYSGVKGRGYNIAGPVRLTTGMDWEGSVRGRVGYAFDRVLVYAAGGVSIAHFDADFTFLPTGTRFLKASTTRTGWTIGGGVEAGITQNLTTRVDYRYSNYGDLSYNLGGLPGKISLEAHRVTGGIAYKF